MITTTEFAPSPALAPFIRCYGLSQMDSKGLDVIKPWHASGEMHMEFNLKDKPGFLNNPNRGQFFKGDYVNILGLASQYNGEVTFNGCYSVFLIMFRATGFNRLFKMKMSDINDLGHHADNVLDRKYKLLFDQLSSVNTLSEMAALADAFFLQYLNKEKSDDATERITIMANLIRKNRGLVSVDNLAYDANMSLRTFERHFMDKVGMAPKLYCCITRFNSALRLKFQNPEMDWTNIVYKTGYFDQMHLIKDFKRFAGYTPTLFLKQTPLAGEKFTSRVEA